MPMVFRVSIILLYLALAALNASAKAQVIKWSNTLPAGHPILESVLKPWFSAVSDATGGRVSVEFSQSPWGPRPRQIDIVELSIRHGAFGELGATPHRFRIIRAIELPFLSNSSEALSVAGWRFHRRYSAQSREFTKAQVVAIGAETPGELWSIHKPITRAADLRNLPILVLGDMAARVSRRLGGLPISMPPPLAAREVAKGQIKTFVGMSGAVRRHNLLPQLRWRTRFPRGLFANAYFVVIALPIWRRITAPDRRAIMAVSGARLSRSLGAVLDRGQNSLPNPAGAIQSVNADAAFIAAAKSRLAPLEVAWVEGARARGIDGAAALRFLRTEIAREEKKLREKKN